MDDALLCWERCTFRTSLRLDVNDEDSDGEAVNACAGDSDVAMATRAPAAIGSLIAVCVCVIAID